MSRFDLEKKSEKVNFILAKKGIKTPPVMRVSAALDISGSMGSIIARGHLQQAFDQMMGVSVSLDDNGELDVFKFDDTCQYVGTANPNNHEKYIKQNRIEARGGTSYAPIVRAAIDFFFTAAKSEPAAPAKKSFFGFGKSSAPEPVVASGTVDNSPVLMMVITDGEPSDKQETLRALEAAQKYNIYFHFVGVGRGRGGGGKQGFPTISYLADALPNVGEVYLHDFGMSDEEVYDQLVCDELIEFFARFSGGNQVTA